MNITDAVLKQVQGAYPNFNLNSPEFLAVEQLTYLSYFLVSAIKALESSEKYSKDDSLPLYDQTTISLSLFRDAIMNYAKCFTTAEQKKIKLDINAVTKSLSNEEKQNYKTIHTEIMDIRNKYIAHNLTNEFEKVIIAAKYENNEISIAPTYTIAMPTDYTKYKDQCLMVQTYLVFRINMILNKIETEQGVRIRFHSSTQSL